MRCSEPGGASRLQSLRPVRRVAELGSFGKNMLLLRALISFLALPGMVAGVIPAWLAARATVDRGTLPWAVGVMAVGCILLFWCVRDFYVSGRGTLAPWDPPKHIVVVGLYRYVRNPMYLAVLTILSGWALLYHSQTQVGYLLLFLVIFHLRVVLFEEPWLRRQFREEWEVYSAAVPRWLPRPGQKGK
ncbi:MAG: isoprenylcysteine carboxylmethyltransferase family protein [Verrucomicrobia bacterium]|nr:isoprenylcysteine carboxylmethyltransferase family protein [Verrucomicrobiota bacterium]